MFVSFEVELGDPNGLDGSDSIPGAEWDSSFVEAVSEFSQKQER